MEVAQRGESSGKGGVGAEREGAPGEEEREKVASARLTRKVPAGGVVVLDADVGFDVEGCIFAAGEAAAPAPSDEAMLDVGTRGVVPGGIVDRRPVDMQVALAGGVLVWHG